MSYQPTEKEREWIAASEVPEEARICVQFAAGVNRKDALLIIDVLAEDCSCESQSIYEKLEGKKAIGEHFALTVENIRKAGPGKETRAELATEPQRGKSCVLLHQRDSAYGKPGLGRPDGYWTVDGIEAGKVTVLFKVTIVPNPYSVRRSGIFPGLTGEEVQAAIDFSGKKLPRSEKVLFLLFTLGVGSGGNPFMRNSPWDEEMKEAVQEILPDFKPARLRLCTMADGELGGRYGVNSFPTLVVACEGDAVKVIEGLYSAEVLRKELSTLFE